MGSDELQDHDAHRLAAVRRYDEVPSIGDNALDRLASIAARSCETPIAVVSLVGSERVVFKGRYGLQLDKTGAEPGLCTTAVHHAGPYVLIDARNDPRARTHPLVLGDPLIRYYAAVPIVVEDGRHIGTVAVMDTQPRRATTTELATLRDIAATASDELRFRRSAIDELIVAQEERNRVEAEAQRVGEIAETLQSTLVPSRLPSIPGLDVAVHYEPFSTDDIGGDFYDLFPINNSDRWGIFVGDVVGKGLEAAAFTSLARYSLRTAAVVEPTPADVLASVNEAVILEPTGGESLYCTVAYGELSPDKGNVWNFTFTVGGHPPPLILRANGELEAVRAGGTIVGAFNGERYTSESFVLAQGDSLVMYSDGMTDIPTSDGWLGVDGILEALKNSAVRSATDAVALLRKIIADSESPLRDDLVILALCVPRTLREA